MNRDPVAEIIAYNRRFVGRYAAPLQQKFEKLDTGGPFLFFRGTFHLFARDLHNGVLDPWPNGNPFSVVQTAIVGDIHSENYGTFKADDGTVHYDVNDFDETTVGGFDFDVRRSAVSLFLAAPQAGVQWPQAVGVVERFARTYVDAINRFAKRGGAEAFGFTDRRPPDAAPVKRLLRQAAEAARGDFINHITVPRGDGRQLKRNHKFFELLPAHRTQAERLLADYLTRRAPTGRAAKMGPDFFKVEDICGRIGGCGSLGRFRYAILLYGEGGKDGRNAVLEFKESLPSACDELQGPPPAPAALRERAACVETVQRAMQTASGRDLGHAVDGEMSFQVRGAGPRDLGMDWADVRTPDEFSALGVLYAELLAKCHAKADAGKGGPDQVRRKIAEALDGREDAFVKGVAAFGLAYSNLVEDDHRRYAARRAEVEAAIIPAARAGAAN